MTEYLPQIIASAIAIVLLPSVKYIAGKLTTKYGKKAYKSELRTKQTKKIIAVMLNVLFVFSLAIIWGVRPQNILLGLSSILAVVGVALFAQWSVLSNISAGVIMFFSAPFRIGDVIHILDKDIPIVARIEGIGTFYTNIRTAEGEVIVMPNNIFLQKIVALKGEAGGEDEKI